MKTENILDLEGLQEKSDSAMNILHRLREIEVEMLNHPWFKYHEVILREIRDEETKTVTTFGKGINISDNDNP